MKKTIGCLKNFVVKGVVIILLLSFMFSYSSIQSSAMPAKAYFNIIVENVESTNAITSSDAKYMNGHIITGVNGSLTLLELNRTVIAKFPEVKVNWIDSVEEDGLVIYGNFSKQLGIAKINQNGDDSYELISNTIICEGKNLLIDPTIIRVNSYYYITFTEVVGKVNNGIAYSENEASKINGEYILHMWRARIDANLGDKSSWEEVSVIQDNFHNTEDIDIMYSDNHFTVFFEYENYDKGCSAIKAIQSLDSEGYRWGNTIELLPNEADHEMASIWDEGDHYTLWYSCDKGAVGKSYMAGRIYYAEYDKDWNLLSKDNEIAENHNEIGGVRLYEVTKIDDVIHFLYAKDYPYANKLSVLKENIWKKNSTGWWAEYSDGSYPVSAWKRIDNTWYYFNDSGYMVSNEWRDGYWLSSNGALEYAYTASWKHNSFGWWFEDGSGWYPSSSWQKIDGCWYYFDASGYMVTNQYVDGYWIGADGVYK